MEVSESVVLVVVLEVGAMVMLQVIDARGIALLVLVVPETDDTEGLAVLEIDDAEDLSTLAVKLTADDVTALDADILLEVPKVQAPLFTQTPETPMR